jgi:cystathionine gamma-synthase
MRTLHLRVAESCKNAMAIAERFAEDHRLTEVLYPGLSTHPEHDLAREQMGGKFGGMLSIRVAGGENAAIAVAGKVKLWKRATSLGGVESLIEHRASIEGPTTPVPVDLLRLSAGIEDISDLIADLEQALEFSF